MKRVVEFSTDNNKYLYVNLVARNLGLYRKVLDVMLLPHALRKYGRDSASDSIYAELPYIGKGIIINKDMAHTARDWRVSFEDADEIKKRFMRLNKSTREKIIKLSDDLRRELEEALTIDPKVYKRTCLSHYVGMVMKFQGVISNLCVATVNEHRADCHKVIKIYINDVSCINDTHIRLDHVTFSLGRDGYLKLKDSINVDAIFNGGVKVQFKAEVCKYVSENRYGLKHIHAVQSLGGGN